MTELAVHIMTDYGRVRYQGELHTVHLDHYHTRPCFVLPEHFDLVNGMNVLLGANLNIVKLYIGVYASIRKEDAYVQGVIPGLLYTMIGVHPNRITHNKRSITLLE